MKLLLSNIESLSCEAHGPFFVELRQVARFYHSRTLFTWRTFFRRRTDGQTKWAFVLYVNEMQKCNGVHLHL